MQYDARPKEANDESALLTTSSMQISGAYRPLSRRLDRCDRMIQNEGNDSRKLFTLKIALCR